jgi:hypothetical protein
MLDTVEEGDTCGRRRGKKQTGGKKMVEKSRDK